MIRSYVGPEAQFVDWYCRMNPGVDAKDCRIVINDLNLDSA